MEAPWTRDGRVRADVVAVAPDVSGLVTEVLVEDNQVVRKGDVLFRIDPDRFRLGLRQAEATVEGRKATAEQAAADYARYSKLSRRGRLAAEGRGRRAADLSAKAAYEQALADRDLAKLNLDRSAVKASVNGRITNMELRPGNYVTTGPRGDGADRHATRCGSRAISRRPSCRASTSGDRATIRLMGDAGVLGRPCRELRGRHRRDRRSDASQPARERQPDLLLGPPRPAHPGADHPRRRDGGSPSGERPDRDGLDRPRLGRSGDALALDGMARGARPLRAAANHPGAPGLA